MKARALEAERGLRASGNEVEEAAMVLDSLQRRCEGLEREVIERTEQLRRYEAQQREASET